MKGVRFVNDKGSKSKLTMKQKAFADYYIETGNATEAALRAGYSKKTSYSIGNENLKKPEVLSYIDERMQEIEDNRIAKGDEVLKYLTGVMRGEVKDQFGLDPSLQDRTKAAELLGKRYRLFTEKVETSTVSMVRIVDDIDEEDKEENDDD